MFNTNIVKKWNYGNYSSNNYGSHSLAFSDNFGNDYYFSYDTLVAFTDDNGLCIRENIWGSTTGKHLNCIRQNVWGTTTGKHLNWIDKDKSIRVGSDIFEARLQALRDKYKK